MYTNFGHHQNWYQGLHQQVHTCRRRDPRRSSSVKKTTKHLQDWFVHFTRHRKKTTTPGFNLTFGAQKIQKKIAESPPPKWKKCQHPSMNQNYAMKNPTNICLNILNLAFKDPFFRDCVHIVGSFHISPVFLYPEALRIQKNHWSHGGFQGGPEILVVTTACWSGMAGEAVVVSQ